MRDVELTLADMHGMEVYTFVNLGGPEPKMSDVWNRGAELSDAVHEAGHGRGLIPDQGVLDRWWQQAALHTPGRYDPKTRRYEPDYQVVGESLTEVLLKKREDKEEARKPEKPKPEEPLSEAELDMLRREMQRGGRTPSARELEGFKQLEQWAREERERQR